ncbi:Fungal specific transcription factor domain [Rhizoctonia solani]|uniref:Fungal specific transcription factor domain n=1 Tax=Rhizoctonia solani TaxID=456999 RepID=A0A8H8T1A1_9AGAM|nr:Fungal specific transcription factor domain [Rhizoctonia solani]QRW24522.1 Fungal specific transcription factor domain [Rhizoctonia solani]
MDKNVKQNTLPFVLQCYSRWALASVFERLKAVHIMKDRIAEHFSLEDTRSKTILAANQVRSFLVATPSSAIASDNKNATHILENTLEKLDRYLLFKWGAQSSLACVLSMDEIALVVQRACCEPSGKLLSLSNILLSPSLNLRHFATLDILRSAVTGRPTYFKYEAQFSSTQYDQIFSQHDYGLQWFYGFPDHFVMIFAWINSLRGIEGAGANAALISQVEMEVQRAETVLGLVWAAANDPRVLRVVKNVTRLIKGAKSGHMPDAYLTPPITIVGLAAYREQDRYVVQQRMLNIVKCAKSKVVAKDLLLQLEDVWTRTRNEKRAAVWSDLRIAYLNVVGI